jgi:small subunit ribosomal protein S1
MEEQSNDNATSDENFADLIDQYGVRSGENIRIGEKIKGKVIDVGKEELFVDTGTKVDGVVDLKELLDESGEMPYRKGDTIELFVVAADEGEIRLSRALAGVGGRHLLEEAHRSQMPIEGKVVETCKGGFRVQVLQRRAFCPVSQMDLAYIENAEDYVGETHRFVITRLEEGGKNIVLSRRRILEKEQKEAEKAFFDNLSVGDELQGRVTRLMPYGVFVELIPGVEGMVHISELSWSRLQRPEEVVQAGDTLKVRVLDIAAGERAGSRKIALSVKALEEDPWQGIAERFSIGEKVRGKVTRCAKFGAFVEITPGVEGLVHISEMSYLKRVIKPEEVVQPGDAVDVMIKEIDADQRRVSLSIRDAEGDPWIEVPDQYRVGQRLEGTLEKKEKFGYFVTLRPGVTGLMPKSKIHQAAVPSTVEKCKEGDRLAVLIDEINLTDRKITLRPADAGDAQDWQQYAGGSQGSLGSLGEKLQAALKEKKKH